LKPAAVRATDSKTQWEKQQELREEKRQQLLCKKYEDRISWIDSRLRAGGYSVAKGIDFERNGANSQRSSPGNVCETELNSRDFKRSGIEAV
jgi:hypothetical protein